MLVYNGAALGPRSGLGLSGYRGLGEEVGEVGEYESTSLPSTTSSNPCGSGYTWDEASSSCAPTQERIDFGREWVNFMRSIGLAPAAPAAQPGGAGTRAKPFYENPLFLLGGAALLVVFVARR